MIPKRCRLFEQDHAIKQAGKERDRFNIMRSRSRAFSGEVDAGSPQKMRPLKKK
jgi:hypothetical protein